MTSDHDLDTLLAAPDEGDMPAGDAFGCGVMRRVERCRGYRRIVVGAAGGLAGVAACMASVALPVPAMPGGPGGAGSVVSILVLVGLCAMAWIGSGSTGARREPR